MPSVSCHCGAKYKIPQSSLGKKAKCKKCDSVFTLQLEDEGIIPLAPQEEDDFRGTFAVEASTAAVISSVGRQAAAPSGLVQAAPAAAARRTERPSKGYWDSLLWTFLFPADPRNIVVFVMMWICLGALQWVIWIPPIGIWLLFAKFVLGLGLFGWYCGYRFQLIEGAAAGDSQLPDLVMEMDLYEEVVRPFFLWIGSWAVVIAPSVLHLTFRDGISDPFQLIWTWMTAFSDPAGLWDTSPVAAVLIYLGLFLWPMIILTVALAGWGSLIRVDLMLISLARSFPAYVCTVALVAGATIAEAFASGRIFGSLTANQVGFAGVLGRTMLAQLLILGVSAYATIVSLRAIGLYYHHFKDKFAWNWG